MENEYDYKRLGVHGDLAKLVDSGSYTIDQALIVLSKSSLFYNVCLCLAFIFGLALFLSDKIIGGNSWFPIITIPLAIVITLVVVQGFYFSIKSQLNFAKYRELSMKLGGLYFGSPIPIFYFVKSKSLFVKIINTLIALTAIYWVLSIIGNKYGLGFLTSTSVMNIFIIITFGFLFAIPFWQVVVALKNKS
jgi:hypothetical protein